MENYDNWKLDDSYNEDSPRCHHCDGEVTDPKQYWGYCSRECQRLDDED